MPDADLDRILADLRKRRELLEQIITETAASATERAKLILDVNALCDRFGGRSPAADDESEQR